MTKEELGIYEDVPIGETSTGLDGKTYIKFNDTQYALVVRDLDDLFQTKQLH